MKFSFESWDRAYFRSDFCGVIQIHWFSAPPDSFLRSSAVERRPHNPEVPGSNPGGATFFFFIFQFFSYYFLAKCWYWLHFLFSKLFYIYLPSSTLFSNPKVFFQKQYTASAIRSKMTLVNVVPQVGPDPKTGVSGMGTFVGGSTPFPAPCDHFCQFYVVAKNIWPYMDI